MAHTAKVLTIAVAAYNVAPYIAQCLDSFVDEKLLPALDIVVIDDGSTDATARIVRKYINRFPESFRLVSQENGGYGAAVNHALALAQEYGISARLTFSNSLLQPEHLSDPTCNKLCRLFAACDTPQSGVIVHSELLLDHLKRTYPSFYFVSSTTKVLTEFSQLAQETAREDFRYVVPDFRLNKAFDRLATLPQDQRDKLEFLCNECCWVGCRDRKVCYEAVSRRNLGLDTPEHRCTAPDAAQGYRFSRAMESPSFISTEDILTRYLPQGFTNFKIEGRGLGSAIVLEFLLYYLTKPEYQLRVREEIYLDSMLDLF